MKLEISKENVIKASKLGRLEHKLCVTLFPEAFKLEKNKWYWYFSEADTKESLVYITNDNNCYGFENNNKDWIGGNWVSDDGEYWVEREASFDEVQERLTQEAVERGFVEGAKFLFEGEIRTCSMRNPFYFSLLNSPELYCSTPKKEWGDCSNPVIFSDGVWAEIVKTPRKMTVKEICEELGEEIEIIK